MRVYFLESTPLAELATTADRPQAGDRVVFLRDAQDVIGDARRALEAEGVAVIRGPDLVTKEAFAEMDAMLDSYLKGWFLDGDNDVSWDGSLSLGRFAAGQLTMAQKPTILVSTGEMARRALADVPEYSTVITDLTDGESPYQTQIAHPDMLPRLSLLKTLAEERGLTVASRHPTVRLPDIHRDGGGLSWVRIIWLLIGGLRPAYLWPRLTAMFKGKSSRRVYVFFNHGLELLARELGHRGRAQVLADRAGHADVQPLRADHIVALMGRNTKQALHRMRAWAQHLVEDSVAPRYVLDGFDYTPFLILGLSVYLRDRLALELTKIAQARRLFARTVPELIVINGGSCAMYGAIAHAYETPCTVLHVDHGLNVFLFRLRDTIHNFSHVVYAAHGTDHADCYGNALASNDKPQILQLPNPATTVMASLHQRKQPTTGRSVLFANFTAGYDHGCGHHHDFDRYMIDLFSAARLLAKKGIRVSYRPHPGEKPGYARFLIDAMGLDGTVHIDTAPSFEDALLDHDAFVSSSTSCLYQALYAGWPAVFYEPNIDTTHLIGMPAASDIERPVAGTVEQLCAMIEQAFEPGSIVADFPGRFRTEYAPRFVGRDAGSADKALADFIETRIGLDRCATRVAL
jgi:hypothetical protein